MSDDKRVPSLRFKGFTDPWERYEFGEIFEERNDRGIDGLPILSVSIHHGISDHALDTAQLGKQVRRSEDKSLYKQVQQGDVVLNMMRAWQGAIGASATRGMVSPAYIVAKPILSSSYSFLDRYLKKPSIIKQINDLSYGVTDFRKRIYWNSFIRVQCAIPCRHEQSRIGALFAKLDSLIAFHQRKHDKLVVLKKSMLEKMFPKPGCKVPEIRFSGFTDPWEQRKLGEMYEKNDERNAVGFGVERTLSIATMTLNDKGNGATEDSLPKYKVIRVGDAAFEGHKNKEFAFGRFVVNDLIDGIMSPRFTCLRPKCDFPVTFWKYYIHNERIMRSVLVRATKSGTMMNELVLENFFQQSIFVPEDTEQTLIGTFFQQLDDLITLHQRELDVLKKVKKSLLEKMFV